MVKNEILEMEITALSNDGNGVGHIDGCAVFVPFTAPGDRARVRIAKVQKNYAFGILTELIAPGPDRIEPDCPAFGRCGGCALRHLRYSAELAAKTQFVQDAFDRIGGFSLRAEPCLPSPDVDRYRNKVQYPLCVDANGEVRAGFFAPRSHRVIPCPDCLLQPALLNEISAFLCRFFTEKKISVYDERTGRGLLRHLYLRHAKESGKVMVCIVANGRKLPFEEEMVQRLCAAFPAVQTVILNFNLQNTNVILGKEQRVLYGHGVLEDTLCGVPVALTPYSFYQVNTDGARQLYGVAKQFADPKPEDLLLDLYCGAGTIGLSMAREAGRVIGVEIVPSAIESARRAAKKMGVADAAFFCADAGTAAAQLAQDGLRPSLILLDPPRKGCDLRTIDAVAEMSPSRVVMVSCNPATAARDAKLLAQRGYLPRRLQPVDLFPRTKHVETVVLLSKLNTKQHIEVELNLDELDLTAAESKATYEEIKAYVLEKYDLKVSSLYISQVKRKCGLDVGQNYNLSKKEDAKVPQCPPEKEAAIMDALKHFQMI